jgi:hypothetical protein
MKKYILKTFLLILLVFLAVVACDLPTTLSKTTKAITSFSFATQAASGIIDENAKTISVTVPNNTNRTALVATFTHTGVKVTVGGFAQVSGMVVNNFTNSVVYRVTAQDRSFADYTVTVTIGSAGPSSAKAITAYSFATPAAIGTINETAKTIDMLVPNGTNPTALVATFTLSQYASATVSGTAQVSGTTVNDFTNPVVYRVTAQDSSTVDYTVTVTVESSGYAEAYNALNLDISEGQTGLTAAKSADPLTGPGSKTYTVNGAKGGSVSEIYTISLVPSPFSISMVEAYTWNNYQGSHDTTISGPCTFSYDTTAGGSLTGTLNFTYGTHSGSITYNCLISPSGAVSGTYTVTYNGETHTYDITTGLEV